MPPEETGTHADESQGVRAMHSPHTDHLTRDKLQRMHREAEQACLIQQARRTKADERSSAGDSSTSHGAATPSADKRSGAG